MHLPAASSLLQYRVPVAPLKLLRSGLPPVGINPQLPSRGPELAAGGLEFVASTLSSWSIQVEFDEAELNGLPATGAFLVVTEGSCSVLSMLALLHVLGKRRPDLRVVVDPGHAALLPQLLQQQSCFVLPKPDAPLNARSAHGMRRLRRLVHNDLPLLLISPPRPPMLGLARTAAECHPALAPLLSAAHVPVVSVKVGSPENSASPWWGIWKLSRRSTSLYRELLSRQGRALRVCIAAPGLAVTHEGLPAAGSRAKAERPPGARGGIAPAALAAELAALPPSCRLRQSRQWAVYIVKSSEAPSIAQEIIRLRRAALGEKAAQRLGQATNSGQRYLFLYDCQAHQVVGAFCLGLGRIVLRDHGRRGFYLHSLFKLKRKLEPLLQQSLEVRGSFIREEFQGQPQLSALLWQGLALFLAAHPAYRYLIGPVSLSHRLGPLSKARMVELMQHECEETDTAALLQVRQAFHFRPLPQARRVSAPAPVEAVLLRQLVSGSDPGGVGVPARLHSYLRRNARIIGFNLSPVSAALDGVVLLDAGDLPRYCQHLASGDGELPG